MGDVTLPLAVAADMDAAEFFKNSPLSAIRLSPERLRIRQAAQPMRRHRWGAKVHMATHFQPMTPHETPEQHLPAQSVIPRALEPRFVNKYDSREILVAIDGSCIPVRDHDHGDGATRVAVAGCSFAYRDGRGMVMMPEGVHHHHHHHPFPPPGGSGAGAVGFVLEQHTNTTPDGEQQQQQHHLLPATSNRAKLRAVIAALEHRDASSSPPTLEYVVLGATKWLAVWIRRRWGRSRRRAPESESGSSSTPPVANRDLWERLHANIDRLGRLGIDVSFWLVSTRDIVRSALLQHTKDLAKDVAAAGLAASADSPPVPVQEPAERIGAKE
ncbi:hypothetical protein F5Y17DRAFT_472498 [Xylariaceae sp. FL0594]|nr:hypothetical protein F5Y17DRAFT_472498 [Xylariaceae sp. FL0594]